MLNLNLSDTIAAIATPMGESGIGIVRMSGKDALSITDKIFASKDGKKPSTFKTYTTHYGWIVENQKFEKPGEFIDEVILTVMRAPKSYTKEDVVEINCHGGIVALRRVLEIVLGNGCRLALPGEFTKRAFLNGRIDLAQAEAVLDIIKSKTESSLKLGLEQLRGGLSQKINQIRNRLIKILSILEANIDFPEEEVGLIDFKKASRDLKNIDNELRELIYNSGLGRTLREGLRAVICGKPNVGKSSTLNALLKEERSIVTPIPGTTRDTIEEIIDIKGIPIRIIDTAGIIEPRGLIEKKAVLRTKRYIEEADLVILLFDGSSKLTKLDYLIIKRLKKKTIIAVINKIDLPSRIEREKLLKIFGRIIDISAKRFKNLNLLEETVAHLVYNGKLKSKEPLLVANLRHIEALKKVKKLIAQAQNSLDNKLSLEFVAQDIKDALGYLDELLGARFSEALLDKIFSEFCIGK